MEFDHFAHEFAKKRKRNPLRFSREALNALFNYDWPGNVRELKNLVERLTILVNGDVADINDLPDKFHSETDAPSLSSDTININTEDSKPIIENLYRVVSLSNHPVGVNDIPDEGINLNQIIDDMERNLILKALKKAGGVKSRAASLLNLNRTTLIEKMKKMGITSLS